MTGQQRSNWWVAWLAILIFIAMLVSIGLIPWATGFHDNVYYR